MNKINKKTNNILVIGGAGYIGSVLVEDLINNKQKVVVYDDLSTGFKSQVHPKAKFIKGCMKDTKKLSLVIKQNKITHIVLLAAKIKVGESTQKPLEYYDTNVNGLISVLEAMKNAKCHNLVFASSAATYGDIKSNKPLSENLVTKPCNPYGWTKYIDEQIIKDYSKTNKINYLLLRFFNVSGASSSKKYGIYDKNTSLLIAKINDAIINNKQFKIFGGKYKTKDKTALRDYIDVRDVSNAIVLGIDYLKKNKSDVFNICSSVKISVLDVIKTAQKVTNKKLNYTITDNRPGDPEILIGDNKKIKAKLNWKPKYDLKEMILSDYQFRLKLN